MHAKLFFIASLLIGVYAGDEVGIQKTCGVGKKCVREHLCLNGQTNTDGETLIHVRGGFDDSNECPFLETCCSTENMVVEPINEEPKSLTGCGYRNRNGVGVSIVNAPPDAATFGEFPWMLAILRRSENITAEGYTFVCGASLIHPQVALTSAHCVYGKPTNTFSVRAGVYQTEKTDEIQRHQESKPVNVVVHENYNKANLHNDIALLFLETPFRLNPSVNPVCLPPAASSFDFAQCHVTGWGKDQFRDNNLKTVLKKIDLPIVPNNVCQNELRKTHLGGDFKLDSSFMCAGGESGKDSCLGDGGSPLFCPIDQKENRYYQTGIVSWGIECGQKNIPGVYANVAQFRRWIDSQLADYRIDMSNFIA